MPLPRLLVVVTLAEAGGAQTFAASLVAGMRDRYVVDVAAHGPEGALPAACARLGVAFHHVEHLVRDPHPRHDARGEQRMAAVLEEVVFERLRCRVEHLRPGIEYGGPRVVERGQVDGRDGRAPLS